MKKLLTILATIVAAGAFSAFGQGYIIMQGSKGYVYDNFTAPGTPANSSSQSSVTFLWSATGANDLLGAGLPTTGAPGNSAAGGWADINTMITSDGWNVATVSGGSEADVAANSSTIAKGGFSYSSGSPFALAGSTAGATIDLVVIGWNNQAGTLNTLEAAEGASSALGWDSEFTYALGASASSPIATSFNTSNGTAFSVNPVPEPTTLALAGLGGLSMLFLRRRKA